ncbi:MAG: M50 family metallopeptidase [Clostridia bacterium]|nr:M50 family metallopeptidase [Clostridia bacterium]
MKIEIDLRVILLMIVFLFTSQIDIYVIFIFFVFLHELAHILVGLALGFKVSSISMNIFGFSAQLYAYKSKKSFIRIITYLAGPIFNLICAIVFYFSKLENEFALKLIYTNLLLFVFNLFPILPLDGGKILKEVLKNFIGNKNASVVMNAVTKVFLIMISAIYSVAILKIKNFAILFLIIYLWYLYSIEEKKLSTLKRVYEIIEKS